MLKKRIISNDKVYLRLWSKNLRQYPYTISKELSLNNLSMNSLGEYDVNKMNLENEIAQKFP